jgi:hypothetical protein
MVALLKIVKQLYNLTYIRCDVYIKPVTYGARFRRSSATESILHRCEMLPPGASYQTKSSASSSKIACQSNIFGMWHMSDMSGGGVNHTIVVQHNCVWSKHKEVTTKITRKSTLYGIDSASELWLSSLMPNNGIKTLAQGRAKLGKETCHLVWNSCRLRICISKPVHCAAMNLESWILIQYLGKYLRKYWFLKSSIRILTYVRNGGVLSSDGLQLQLEIDGIRQAPKWVSDKIKSWGARKSKFLDYHGQIT